MKAGRKSSSRGSGDGGGNELFSLLPAASGATDQTRPHGFISYAEEANTTSHSNVKLHRSEGVVLLLFVVFRTSLKCVTVKGKKPEGKDAAWLAQGS